MVGMTPEGIAMRYRNLIMPFIFVIAGGAGLPAASAQPAAAPEQATAPGEIASLAELPADVRTVIGPDVADRGGAFAAGCVSAKGEPHSRFAGARLNGDTLHVTMEYGGIAHYFDTLEFRQLNGRWVHVPKQPGQGALAQAPVR
jgi:hypothetical protein